MAERHYSGELKVRVPPELYRQLAIAAAGQDTDCVCQKIWGHLWGHIR
ncbi:MAG: toxin-antitoxin system HicB family antitoxin [Wenzhouxiangella sp.]